MNKVKVSDVGRRVRIFDRPAGQGSGLLGFIMEVFDEKSFRFMRDNGRETEYFDFRGVIQFIDEVVE